MEEARLARPSEDGENLDCDGILGGWCSMSEGTEVGRTERAGRVEKGNRETSRLEHWRRGCGRSVEGHEAP